MYIFATKHNQTPLPPNYEYTNKTSTSAVPLNALKQLGIRQLWHICSKLLKCKLTIMLMELGAFT